MKKVLLAAFAGMVILFTGCKGGASGDPKAVLAEFFTLLSKKDIAGARKLATADSKQMLDLIEMGMKTNPSETDKYGAAKMEYGEAKIEGDKATVAVKEKESGETLNYTLKKENGSWKVAFDKSSIMTMGMEKMNEKGININDSLNNVMDEINKLDADSLAGAIKEGAKAMDSAAKVLEELKNK